MRKGWLAVAILLLALVVFFGVRQAGNGGGEDGGPTAKGSQPTKSKAALAGARTATRSGNELNGPVRLEPSPGVEPSENFPEYQTHEPEQLGECFLPPLTAENVTLREAVQLILQSYTDVCTVTKQEPLVLSIRIPEELDERMDFELPGASLTKMLMMAGLRYGLVSDQVDDQFSYRRMAETYDADSDELATRIWDVPPTLRSDFNALMFSNPGRNDSALSFSEFFGLLGYPMGEASPVSFIPSESRLVFKGTPKDFEALDNFLQASVLNTMATQIRGQIRLVEPVDTAIQEKNEPRKDAVGAGFDAPSGGAGGAIIGASLGQPNGVTTRSGDGTQTTRFPSTLSRNGETAEVSLIEGESEQWTGVHIKSQLSRYGFGIHQRTEFESRPPDGTEMKKVIFDFEQTAPHGAQMTHQETGPDGHLRTIIVSSGILNARGQAHDPLAQEEGP
jgi:hypothetical protein